jgi:hypothetical protein
MTIPTFIDIAEATSFTPDIESCPLTLDTLQFINESPTVNHIFISTINIGTNDSDPDIIKIDMSEPTAPTVEYDIISKIRKESTILQENDSEPIPLPDSISQQIKTSHLKVAQQEQITELCTKYPNIWSTHEFDVGKVRFIKHRIQVNPTLPPSDKRRTVAQTKLAATTHAIKEMMAAGIITKIN